MVWCPSLPWLHTVRAPLSLNSLSLFRALSDSYVQWATCSLECKEGTIFLSYENMFPPLKKKRKHSGRSKSNFWVIISKFKLLSMLKFWDSELKVWLIDRILLIFFLVEETSLHKEQTVCGSQRDICCILIIPNSVTMNDSSFNLNLTSQKKGFVLNHPLISVRL